LKLVHFKILDQFSHSYSEIRRFSHFNQILLSLFDISSAFHNIILYFLTHFCFNVKSNTIAKLA